MKSETLEDLFVDELKDQYDAEKQLVKALPKMAKAAMSADLKQAFTGHLDETKGHVTRLEKVFELLEMKAQGKTCEAMKGLVTEGGEAIEEHEGSVRDAALIAAAQRVEHYEIAGYGTLLSFAQQLGHDKVAKLLQATLDEEKDADERLSEIAESEVNPQAMEVASQAD
jgi:ferritin-like metal-binding protein YciE